MLELVDPRSGGCRKCALLDPKSVGVPDDCMGIYAVISVTTHQHDYYHVYHRFFLYLFWKVDFVMTVVSSSIHDPCAGHVAHDQAANHPFKGPRYVEGCNPKPKPNFQAQRKNKLHRAKFAPKSIKTQNLNPIQLVENPNHCRFQAGDWMV